jgi:hypothetical protein
MRLAAPIATRPEPPVPTQYLAEANNSPNAAMAAALMFILAHGPSLIA